MTETELMVCRLFDGKEIRFPHPITVLNPIEWTTVNAVSIDENRIYVSSKDSCWFNLAQCELRDAKSRPS